MNYEFFTTQERLDSLIEKRLEVKVLGDSETDKEFLHIEVTIKDGMDALKLFHAGIDYGVNFSLKRLNK